MLRSLLLLCLCLHRVWGQQLDLSVCDPNKGPTPVTPAVSRPDIPDQYETHIECIIINKNFTTEVHEFYDYPNNRGSVRQTMDNIPYWAIYSYDTNEFIGYYPTDKSCYVSDLSRSDQRFLFGFKAKGGDLDKGHIFSASGALHFGSDRGYPEVYTGKAVVRGIDVDSWWSCQYWADMNATMIIQWYFSDQNAWDMAIGALEIPVRAYVKGKVQDTPTTSHSFEHIYDFIHFKDYISEDGAFQIPTGVTCPGRKNTLPIPNVPQAYSFTVEIQDNTRQQVSYMREWYDNDMQLVKYKYKPSQLSQSQFGFRPLTEIHDFNTGVAYVMDDMLGNCTATPIERNNFDTKTLDSSHVRIRTAKEFFYQDNVNPTYEGVQQVRSMDADSWVAKRTDFPPGMNSTWEWYYRTSYWNASQDSEAMLDGGTPLMLRLTIPDFDIKYTYNVFNFIRSRPNLLEMDVSPCYVNKNRRKFDFTLPGQYASMIQENIELFRYSVLMSTMGYLRMNPLRIANLQLAFLDVVHVSMELLDVAPRFGDVTNNVTETPLDLAANLLVTAINTNKFVIMLDYDTLSDTKAVVATPNSVKEYNYLEEVQPTSPSGYGSGSMAGLGIGMLILAALIGAIAAFFFFK